MKNLLKAGLRRISGMSNAMPTGPHTASVLAVAAQKGGVGKTTTSVNLAAALARYHGRKVLLIDLDPQGHVNTALETMVHPGGGKLSRVLTEDGAPEVREIAATTKIPGLEVTPFDAALRHTEDLLGTRIGKEFILRDALKITRTWYDHIVIDCPPNLGNLAINGLVAADQVLIPCDPSPLALKGVDALVEAVGAVAARLNPEIDVLGILLTRVDGRNRTMNAAIVDAIETNYGKALLPVQIGINSALAKAQLEGQDIFEVDPGCRGADQYRDLAAWVAGAVA
jgi:chromosome partitioning protein